ncbi:MAG: hypothetical protein Q4A27_00130 [bacterium]|jgi:hypothetical protein|nr:hypothetical protein [bacterium]DAK73834.1 MAG TPA: hypothetical protein [Caudoviricetes sp.]DAR69905.1 MAG TPA: hypothetical protein [Caudoviricetes sp.]
MNKAKKYDDKRIKSLLNPHLKKEMVKKTIFVSDEVKQKLNIDSPDNFFEVEVDQRVMDKEHERVIDSSIKILEEIKERV